MSLHPTSLSVESVRMIQTASEILSSTSICFTPFPPTSAPPLLTPFIQRPRSWLSRSWRTPRQQLRRNVFFSEVRSSSLGTEVMCQKVRSVFIRCLFAIAQIRRIGHDHQAPFWHLVVVLFVFVLRNKAVRGGENKLPHGQYTLDPNIFTDSEPPNNIYMLSTIRERCLH